MEWIKERRISFAEGPKQRIFTARLRKDGRSFGVTHSEGTSPESGFEEFRSNEILPPITEEEFDKYTEEARVRLNGVYVMQA